MMALGKRGRDCTRPQPAGQSWGCRTVWDQEPRLTVYAQHLPAHVRKVELPGINSLDWECF